MYSRRRQTTNSQSQHRMEIPSWEWNSCRQCPLSKSHKEAVNNEASRRAQQKLFMQTCWDQSTQWQWMWRDIKTQSEYALHYARYIKKGIFRASNGCSTFFRVRSSACICYGHVQSQFGKEIDESTQECLFLKYEKTSKSVFYGLYSSSHSRALKPSNVKCDEQRTFTN